MELTHYEGEPLRLNEQLYYCMDDSGIVKLTIEKDIQSASFALLPYTHNCEKNIHLADI